MTRAVLVALLAAVCTALPLSGAQAAAGGLLRLAHLSPDTPAVDVYVHPVAGPGGGTAPLTVPGVEYGTVSAYQVVPPGIYTVSVRGAGAEPDTPPALSTTVRITAGSARTVAGVGLFADLDLEVLDDDLTPPAAGQARVRVVAAAATAPILDATAGPTPLATGLAFARTGDHVVLPGGTRRLLLTAQGTPTELPLDLAAGSVYSLVVLDRPGGGLTVRTVLDAVGAGAVPIGGVEAGAGGAAEGATLPVGVTAVLSTLALGAGLSAISARARLSGYRRPPPRHATRRWGRLPSVRVLLAVVAVAASAVALIAPRPGTAAARAPSVASDTAEPSGHPVVLSAPARGDLAEPVRLRVPGIGVDSPLERLGLDLAGSLETPVEPRGAGWFDGGPAPGDVGPAVLAGHVDSPAGPAVFWRLRDLAPGDEVLVDRADGTTARFSVTRVERHPKDAFPTDDVYGPTPDAQLRLVTCGGEFDRATRRYRDNVVVFARPAS